MLVPSTSGESRYAMSKMNEAPSTGGWYEPKQHGNARKVLGVAFDGQTWSNLAYLLLALPLGVLYFTVLAAVVTVGGGLIALVVGAAILVAAAFAWPLVAEFERGMANGMLGTRIEPLPFKQAVEPGLWPMVSARLSSTSTWQSLLYLFLRLPIGMFAFVAGIVGFVLAPFTLTMSLHIINGAAFVVARLTEALLQPWDTNTHAATTTGATAPTGAMPESPPSVTEASSTEGERADPAPPKANESDGERPLYNRAQETAASFTDRVQAVTDELSERARAAARAWNQPGAGMTTQTPPKPEPAPAEVPQDPDQQEREAATLEALSRVQVDVLMRRVTVNDEAIELTPKEFDLLALFVQNPARPFTRDELLDRIWKNEYDITDRTIDTHVQRLRKKLGDAAAVIQTVWGVGYKYQPPR